MRNVGAHREAPARLEPVGETHRRRHVDHVEDAVVGMGSGRHVEAVDELRVHRRDDPPAPPRPPRHEVRDEPVLAAVYQHRAQVDRHPHRLTARLPADVAPPAQRATKVTTGQAERWRPLPRLPGRLDHPAGLGVAVHDDAVVGQRARLAPGLALPDGQGASTWACSAAPTTSSSVDEIETTPRCSASVACRAARAVAGSGAMSPTWRTRSMRVLMLRTKSPPDSSSSPSTSPSGSPAAQAWARGTKPGSGARVPGSPAASSSARSSSASRSRSPHRVRTSREGNHGGGGVVGPRCSYVKHDTSPPHEAGSRPSSRPLVIASATSRSLSWYVRASTWPLSVSAQPSR